MLEEQRQGWNRRRGLLPVGALLMSAAASVAHAQEPSSARVAQLDATEELLVDLGLGRVDLSDRAVARAFYERHPDQFDLLILWTDFPITISGVGAAGLYVPVSSEVTGLNLDLNGRFSETFDMTEEYGSAGRLKGIVIMGALTAMPADPEAPTYSNGFSVLDVLSQETLHQYGAFVNYLLDGELRSDLLGRSQAHWSFFAHSGGSDLEGNRWREDPAGVFTSEAPGGHFSHLDQYLMGLRLPEQVVEPFFIIEQPEVVTPSEAGVGPMSTPREGVVVRGRRQEVTVTMIEDAHGPRRPSARESVKRWRQAFVLVGEPGGEREEALEKLERYRRRWGHVFYDKAEERGRVVTTLSGCDDLPRWGFVTSAEGWEVEGGSAEAGVEVGHLALQASDGRAVTLRRGGLCAALGRVRDWRVVAAVDGAEGSCAISATLRWLDAAGATLGEAALSLATDGREHTYTAEVVATGEVGALELTVELPEGATLVLRGLEGRTAASFPDRDGDGVLDDVDNCPESDNPAQRDEDGDGAGDACDGGGACATRPSGSGDGCAGCGVTAPSPSGGWWVVLWALVHVARRRREADGG